jgi:hypothetical protein
MIFVKMLSDTSSLLLLSSPSLSLSNKFVLNTTTVCCDCLKKSNFDLISFEWMSSEREIKVPQINVNSNSNKLVGLISQHANQFKNIIWTQIAHLVALIIAIALQGNLNIHEEWAFSILLEVSCLLLLLL